MADVIDTLSADALPSLIDATEVVDPAALAPVDGRVDLAPMQEAAPVVVTANDQVVAATRQIAEVETDELWAPLAGPFEQLTAQVADIAATTATAARAVQLLPAMLGADGPRSYLLLVQSPAEPRAGGGIPGSVILLRADGGAVEVVEQRAAGGVLSGLPEPVLRLTPAEMAMFGEGLGIFMADVTFTPDFPRTGELARAIWAQQIGGEVDGVISIDPGALSYAMTATGPLTLANGDRLTADNVVPMLLNTVYVELAGNAEHDAYFAMASAAVFDAVLSGAWEPAVMVDGLARAARESRLLVWSAHEEEQSLLSGTVLSGELTGVRGDAPVIGLYVNDGTASKIGYYLEADVTATVTGCFADGSQAVKVVARLTSLAPENVTEFPPYVSGTGAMPPGVMQANALLYAPSGGQIEEVEVDPGPQGVTSQVHNGLQVVGRTVQLAPGDEVIINYDIRTGSGQQIAPEVRITPLAFTRTEVLDGDRCSPHGVA